MRSGDFLADVNFCIHDAMITRLPKRFIEPTKYNKEGYHVEPSDEKLEVYVFEQLWGNTAIGFNRHNGIAGQAMTSAYTVALVSNDAKQVLVYFGGRFAYRFALPEDRDELMIYINVRFFPSQREANKKFIGVEYE